MNEKVKILSTIELFSSLNNEALETLAEDFLWKEYSDGACIVYQGQPHKYFFVFVEGIAKVIYAKSERDSMQVQSFGPGDTFGEFGLLNGKPASTTLQCSGDCRLLVLEAEHFAEMLVQWPQLYHNLIRKLSLRFDQAQTGFLEARHREFLRIGLSVNQLKYKFYNIWGGRKTTWDVEQNIERLSKNISPILLIGKQGTGQQMMAWHLHKRQFGEKAPFIVLSGRQFYQLFTIKDENDFGNLPMLKVEDLFAIAEGGTLLIRDINLVTPEVQLMLANALKTQAKFCRVIATIRSTPDQQKQKIVPELLHFFTNEYTFSSLRHRKKDIPVIAQAVLQQLAERSNKAIPIIDKEAMKLLLTHNYRRGNVTELIQIIERAFFLAEGHVIGSEHLFFGPTGDKLGKKINLLDFDKVSNIIKKQIYPLWIKRGFFVVFVLGLFALFLQPESTTGVGLLLAWNIWWPALAVLSSLMGRVWCGVCPFSYAMEISQKYLHFDRPVPEIIKKYDYLFITFLFCFIFWLEIVTGMRYSSLYTGLLIIGVLLTIITFGIIFTRHAWCHHLCPLGGFISMTSIGGVLEVRANPEICLNKCTTHECYRGTPDIPGCPMSQHTAFLDNNQACKFCLNCVKSCPNGSVQLNLRAPAREVWHLVRINQGFAIFVGVALGILGPIMYFEPLFYSWPKLQWQLWFTVFFWGIALASGIITWFLVKPFKTKAASRRVKLAFAIVPIVVSGYIAYHLHYIPGLDSLLLSLSYTSKAFETQIVNISAITLSQIVTTIGGIVLASAVIAMVIIRTKKSS